MPRITRARTTLCARGVVTKPTGRSAVSSVRTPRTTYRPGMIATNTCARWATRGHANILEVVEHHGHRSIQSEDQGVHVRPVRDHRRHAEGPDGGSDSLLAAEGMEWPTGRVRDLVAAHPLRELHDRCAASQGAYVLPGDRAARRRLHSRARRNSPHDGRDSRPRSADRAADAVSRRARGASPLADALQNRRALER